MMNSMDSLATNRTVDSLKYSTYRHSSMDSSTTPTAPAQKNGFSTVPRSDHREMAKSPTTSFAELNQSAHYASTTLPKKSSPSAANSTLFTNRHASTDGSPPSTVTTNITPIRLQLEEKRQQYEREKQLKDADLLRNRQNLGQQAFLTALGKTPPSQLNSSMPNGSLTGSPSLMTRSMFASPTPSRVSPKAKQEEANVIQQMQEEIRRLSMQQSQLTQMISGNNKGASDSDFPTIENRKASMSALDSVDQSNRAPTTSFRPASFRLHTDNVEMDNQGNYDVTKKDPELELRRDRKNFGMTYRMRNSMDVEDLETQPAFVLNQRPMTSRNSVNAEDPQAVTNLERSKTFHRGEPVNAPNLLPEAVADTKSQSVAADSEMYQNHLSRSKNTSMSSDGDYFPPPHSNPLTISTGNFQHLSDAQLLGVDSLPSPVRHVETRQQHEGSPGFNFIVGDDQKQKVNRRFWCVIG